MPGITVDRSGSVTAQGEQVRKVTVDGKDFFGDDATMALKNLPSEVVDKIQVFDRLSDQAQLTGFDDGNSVKAINIVTKSQVTNGQFGRIYAGYGTEDRYAAGGNISFFSGDRRVSFVGNFNNINQQNFASQDLLGLTSSGGGRGGGGGSYRGGGGSDNFSVGMEPGISKTNAFGVNFSDKWGKKKNFDVAASYFFNNSNNTNETNRLSQTPFTTDSIRFTGSNSFSNSNNNNHRFNLRAEYKIDSNNTIYIIPSISFQDNNAASSGSNYTYNLIGNEIDSINSSINRSNSNRNGYNINNNIMYRHSFAKRGRTLSLGFQTAFNKNAGESYNYNALKYYKDGIVTDSLLDQYRDNNTNGNRYSARANYSEPIGKEGQLEFEYEYEVQHNKADQQTYANDGGGNYDIFQPLQSNKFDNTITTNTAEVDYRLGRSRDNQFSIGVDFQNSKLEGNRIYPPGATPIRQHFNTLLPNMRWSKKLV
ncbi:outer membrane beta-barrel protein [Niabella ginsengisoli]|uniref:Outer membrane beta-barrel family protein n=1 Tax=Niabella ginsengisoli TaxID=522298 RepID=A0ABS9SPF9_9BACT|nr:outer membrane beta-barrel protein [Niabella ginsengisoli]MCH5600256.1 outer membrane beta-barrel family protein [Niabella ginsengisoli]